MDYYDIKNPNGAHKEIHTVDWWRENVTDVSCERDGCHWFGVGVATLDEENEINALLSGGYDGPEPTDRVIETVGEIELV